MLGSFDNVSYSLNLKFKCAHITRRKKLAKSPKITPNILNFNKSLNDCPWKTTKFGKTEF